MAPRSFVSLTALAASLALVLTACVPEPPTTDPTSPAPTASTPGAVSPTGSVPSASPMPTASPSPTSTTPATPTPTPTASTDPGTPSRVVLPACANLLPLSTVHALFGDAAEPLDAGGSAADRMPGPRAAEAARSARQTVVCSWGIPFSDGGFSVVAAELSTASRDSLLASLRGASSYRATRIDGATAFTHSEESEFGTIGVVYVFEGRVWITVTGTLTIDTGREFAASALDAVRAANP